MVTGTCSLESLEVKGLVMDGRFWKDRRVLVTGATGLQGGWLVRSLLEVGAEVVTLVRDWVPQSFICRSKLIESVRVVRGDITDQEVVERVLGEYEVKTVFHLAAQAIVTISNRNPISTFESNIRGTWIVLEACRRSPTVQEILVASSDKAYGEHDQLPYTENFPLQGKHPYDVSKSCTDLITQAYAATFNLSAAITRYGNLYGGGDLNWSRIVPGTIRSILRNEQPVIRSDGQLTRDYFYVEDGASAYMLLAERIATDPSLRGQTFNFSNETPITVIDLVKRILLLMHREDLSPVIQNDVSHEIPHQYLDATKARKHLGWGPLFDLEEGMRKTIHWYEEFFNLK